jgi:Colicin V production protein
MAMIIWILAVVLIAASVALGHRQGAIRAAFTFVGIVTATLLAVPVGKLLKPLLPHLGIHSNLLIWIVAPFVAYIILLTLFKVVAFTVHRKTYVYYKYKAGDLRRALWERMNARLGACIGTLNGTAYLVLICFVFYNFSYWTAQIAPSSDESRTTRFVNQLGHDMDSTGMDKVARSMATLPDNYYKTANLAGLICQNPQLSERLANYPAFLSLQERSDLQQLTQNSDFDSAWNSHAPFGQIANEPAFKDALKNNDLVNTVWNTVETNLDDLMTYLKTGKSPKYDSIKILGRWDFNVSVTVATLMQDRPNVSSKEMRSVRAWMSQAYAKTTFIAGGDGQAFLKDLPQIKIQRGQPPSTETITWAGQWTQSGTNYEVSLSANGKSKSLTADTDGLRLTLKGDRDTLVFDRED